VKVLNSNTMHQNSAREATISCLFSRVIDAELHNFAMDKAWFVAHGDQASITLPFSIYNLWILVVIIRMPSQVNLILGPHFVHELYHKVHQSYCFHCGFHIIF